VQQLELSRLGFKRSEFVFDQIENVLAGLGAPSAEREHPPDVRQRYPQRFGPQDEPHAIDRIRGIQPVAGRGPRRRPHQPHPVVIA